MTANGTLNASSGDDGGGVSWNNNAGGLSFIDCIVSNNYSKRSGGAIMQADADAACTTRIVNTVFYGNTASYHGGAAHLNSKSASYPYEITNSIFRNNYATNNGGAIQVVRNTKVDIYDSLFDQNTADLNGGAMFFTNSAAVTCQGCSFVTNAANATGSAGGGVVYHSANKDLDFYNCGFTNNTAKVRGGVIYIANAAGTGPVVFSNCTMTANGTVNGGSGDDGGGVSWSANAQALNFIDCVISNNYSAWMGGAVAQSVGGYGCTTKVENTVFYGNSASMYGGAACLNAHTFPSTITNSIFRNNYATNYGGAICFKARSSRGMDITDTEFRGNATADKGGAVYTETNITFRNCLFETNKATGNGGAVYVDGVAGATSLLLDNTTFYSNSSAANGGAIYTVDGKLYVTNSIFWTNQATLGRAVYIEAGETLNIDYCSVWHTNDFYNAGTLTVGANMVTNADPLFVDAGAGNLRVQSTQGHWVGPGYGDFSADAASSLCIDAGMPSSSYVQEQLPDGGRVNIGRYGNTYQASLSPMITIISNAAPTNVLDTSAWLNGYVGATGAAPTYVYCFWGTSDGLMVEGGWEHSEFLGEVNASNALATNIATLSAGTVYYYRYYASNALGKVWAKASTNFTTITLPTVTAGSGVTGIGLTNATLNGNLTAGDLAAICIYWGTFDGGDTNTAWEYTNGLGSLPEGAFAFTNCSLVRGQGYYYRCYATNALGYDWADASTYFIPGVRYMKLDAAGANDGSSWADAYTTMTNALKKCPSSFEIWAAASTNTPGSAAADTFTITNNTIYGGFLGTETARDQRDCVNNQTILDGNGTASRIVTKSSANDALLDGLIIRNGKNTTANSNGSGIYLTGGNLSLLNCTLTNNTCAQNGAALYLSGLYGVHEVSNCLFAVNQTLETDGDGGGIYFDTGTSLDIYDSIFTTNSSAHGGAIRVAAALSTVTITNSLFLANTSKYEAAVCYLSAGNLRLFSCQVIANSNRDWNAGALYLNAAGGAHVISNCTFEGNRADGTTDDDGGVIYFNTGASLDIYNSMFITNIASRYGGVLATGTGEGKVRVFDTTCIGNTAGSYGGGFYLNTGQSYSQPIIHEVTRCSFYTNTSYGDGGAIRTDDGGMICSNSVFTGNVAGNGGDEGGGAVSHSGYGLDGFYGCGFTNNTAYQRGGAVKVDNSYNTGPVLFSNCIMTLNGTLNKNDDNDGGGATWSANGLGFTIVDCIMSNNYSAWQGGAVMRTVYESICTGRIENTIFHGNSATQYGGALYLNPNPISEPGMITNVVFRNNFATNSGGALYRTSVGTTLMVLDTEFRGNATANNGGAVAAMQISFQNCLFETNAATANGGAVWLDGTAGQTELICDNSTFYSNSAAKGGAIYTLDGNLYITNSIFWTNQATLGRAVYIEAGETLNIDSRLSKIKF